MIAQLKTKIEKNDIFSVIYNKKLNKVKKVIYNKQITNLEIMTQFSKHSKSFKFWSQNQGSELCLTRK